MVKTPNEWLTSVASNLSTESTLESVANVLGEKVSAKNVLDYAAVYTGIVIKGLPKDTVINCVKGKRKGVQTAAVNSALKERNIPAELLLPEVKRGRTTKPTVMPSDDELLALFGESVDSEEN